MDSTNGHLEENHPKKRVDIELKKGEQNLGMRKTDIESLPFNIQ